MATAKNDVTGAWKKPKYELDDGQLTKEQYAKIKELATYELNKSTGEVQKKESK